MSLVEDNMFLWNATVKPAEDSLWKGVFLNPHCVYSYVVCEWK